MLDLPLCRVTEAVNTVHVFRHADAATWLATGKIPAVALWTAVPGQQANGLGLWHLLTYSCSVSIADARAGGSAAWRSRCAARCRQAAQHSAAAACPAGSGSSLGPWCCARPLHPCPRQRQQILGSSAADVKQVALAAAASDHRVPQVCGHIRR